MLQVLLGVLTLALPARHLAAAQSAGCFHYGYAYTGELSNVTGNPFTVESALACQQLCASKKGCFHFGYYTNKKCYLGEAKGILRHAVPGTIAGPAFCNPVNPSCTELPTADFPGKDAEASQLAWPYHEQPTSLQCWPRRDDGLPMRCKNRTATVLEDTQTGWAAKCEGLTKITDLAAGETCQQRCLKTPLCSVWSIETETDQGGAPVCWQGPLGSNCHSSAAAPTPLRAQRIQHGTYRVLMSTMGMQIMGLVQSFDGSVFSTWEDGAKHCKLECRSYLMCEFWQYSKAYGCWINDPRKKQVDYPLVSGGSDPSVSKSSSTSQDMVAGEMIQHNCVGEMSALPAESSLPHEKQVAVAADESLAQDGSWPWWVSPLIFFGVVLCISVIGAAAWMGYDDYQRRQMRQGSLPQADSFESEQAGLLGSVANSFSNMNMPQWGHQTYHQVSGGMPGYGQEMHPAAHQQSHGGRFF